MKRDLPAGQFRRHVRALWGSSYALQSERLSTAGDTEPLKRQGIRTPFTVGGTELLIGRRTERP